jgi:hypothetical protein
MPSIEIDIVINREYNAKALIDLGYTSYRLISKHFTQKHQLKHKLIIL